MLKSFIYESFRSQFHKGSSISLCSLFLAWLDYLTIGSVKGGDNSSEASVMTDVSGFRAGTRWRSNLWFLINILLDLILM